VSGDVIKEVTIPIFSGFIGYATNWSGVWMLFNPLEFKGIRVPGLKSLANNLPRRIQQIPGVMQGGFGWQGIIPSRAAKMGSIAVDKGIAKVGSPRRVLRAARSAPDRRADPADLPRRHARARGPHHGPRAPAAL